MHINRTILVGKDEELKPLRARCRWEMNIVSSVVPQVCSADPKGSVTGSQGIRGYISVIATLKFPYFLIKVITFC
jgi:hypothetical protein